jgi:hypothetical protein
MDPRMREDDVDVDGHYSDGDNFCIAANTFGLIGNCLKHIVPACARTMLMWMATILTATISALPQIRSVLYGVARLGRSVFLGIVAIGRAAVFASRRIFRFKFLPGFFFGLFLLF